MINMAPFAHTTTLGTVSSLRDGMIAMTDERLDFRKYR